MTFISLGDTALSEILRTGTTSHAFTTNSFEELFLLSGARVIRQNWNKPNFTFFIIFNSEGAPLYLDNFQIDEFVEGAQLSPKNFPHFLQPMMSHQLLLAVEFVEKDPDEEDEYVFEAWLQADDEALRQLEQPEIRASLRDFAANHSPVNEAESEMLKFILASLP